MSTRIYRTIEELNSLSDEWNSLLTRSQADNVFLTWQWISTWLELHESSLRLFVVAIRDEQQQLVGLAPFYKCDYRIFGSLPCRCLRVIGDSNSAGEYGNIIAAGQSETDVLNEVMKILHDYRKEWDFLWLHDMANWHSGSRAMISSVDHSALRHRAHAKSFGYIPLPGSFPEFLSGVSGNLRRSMRKAHREILQHEATQVTEPSSNTEVSEALAILIKLHQKRWIQLRQSGSFVKLPLLQNFHQTFSAKAQRKGWLKFYLMTINGTPVAAQYGLVYNNVFLQLLEGFDPDAPSGAGSALRSHVIHDLCDLGVSEYDFLGGYSSHKQRWSAMERIGCDLLVTNTRAVSQLLHYLPVWPTGRFLNFRSNSS